MFSFISNQWKKFWTKTTFALGKKIKDLFSKETGENTLENLQQLFYESDLGVEIASELTEKVRSLLKKNPKAPIEEILSVIKIELLSHFTEPIESPLARPHVILIVGVNGSGKTTSIAKLAHFYQKQGKKVLIAAGDTYRAAAVEQLEKWALKIGIEIIKSQKHGDPAAVAFDALQAAKARHSDIVLIDTAGRLHTKKDLMQELEKIRRICGKVIEKAPHDTFLILDGTTGQNAIEQTQTFHQFTPISGIIVTKLDGSAKGGIIVAIQKKFHIPIRWIGIGEKETDFAPFDPKEFVDALLSLE
ncbi:MAG: signal recognition particle-docking protein FtsY [Chlamydiota bacterium]